MKLKDKEAWLELYEVANKIQELEPWKYLWDMDLLVYLSNELDYILYCSVMRRAGMHRAIAIYQSSQIHGFLKLYRNQYPEHMLINYQECLTCNFLSRQDTLPKNREIIKELGLSFRGTWISFENFEKGYEPSPISIKQVKIMPEALKNFYEMFKCIVENGLQADFENGETLVRYYDSKSKSYINHIDKLMIPEMEYCAVKLSDEFEKEVMKLPQTDIEIEYEFLNYIPMRIREYKEDDGRYYYPRARYLTTRNSNFVIPPDLIDKNDYNNEKEYIMESVEYLIESIFKMGRPKRIYVRDEETKMLLKELEEKAQIKIMVKPKLKEIDKFYRSMDRMM